MERREVRSLGSDEFSRKIFKGSLSWLFVGARNRDIGFFVTGGTFGSKKTKGGPRGHDRPGQEDVLFKIARVVPYTTLVGPHFLDGVFGDSSEHPDRGVIPGLETVLRYSVKNGPIVLSYGSDREDYLAALLAFMGKEVIEDPITVVASMKGRDVKGTDVFRNFLVSLFFTRYIKAAGVFQVREDGIVISSRNDGPQAALIDWHSRRGIDGPEIRNDSCFSRVPLEKLVRQVGDSEDQFELIFAHPSMREVHWQIWQEDPRSYRGEWVDADPINVEPSEPPNWHGKWRWKIGRSYKRKKMEKIKRTPGAENLSSTLHRIMNPTWELGDSTLDTEDLNVLGSRRGVNITPHILGLEREPLSEFLSQRYLYEIGRRTRWGGAREQESLRDIIGEKIVQIASKMQEAWLTVGRIIPSLALVEHVRCHRKGGVQKSWKDVLQYVLEENGIEKDLGAKIVHFWDTYSGRIDKDFEINGVKVEDVRSDLNLMLQEAEKTSRRGIILRATGASGARISDEIETIRPFLLYCRDQEIPVVLVSSKPGEVTSLDYGPGYSMFEEDLCFFAGTVDADLVLPRLYSLNARTNVTFLNRLVDSLDITAVNKYEFRRKMCRQLLSGVHYRRQDGASKTDRELMQEQYGIETRVDLHGAMHSKKAFLSAYLHFALREGLSLPNFLPEIEPDPKQLVLFKE